MRLIQRVFTTTAGLLALTGLATPISAQTAADAPFRFTITSATVDTNTTSQGDVDFVAVRLIVKPVTPGDLPPNFGAIVYLIGSDSNLVGKNGHSIAVFDQFDGTANVEVDPDWDANHCLHKPLARWQIVVLQWDTGQEIHKILPTVIPHIAGAACPQPILG
jgi:hypothetical protein